MGWQRRLTGMERWHWLLDRAAPMNVVFVARTAGRFDAARLREALAVVAAHYPILTARIEPGQRPLFCATDHEIPVHAVPWSEGAWRAHGVAEANHRITATTGPLARVLVLDGGAHSDLLFTFNQAMADGLSGAHLLDEVLTVYGGGARPALRAAEVLDPPLVERLGSGLAALATTLRQTRACRALTPLPRSNDVPPEQRRTALLDAQLPASFTEALAQRAGEHGSSVHGALAAAVLLSIGAELRGDRHTRHHDIGCATPVDLRRRVDLAPVLVGNFLSRVVSCQDVHYDSLFWDLAANVSASLRHATTSNEVLAYARLKELRFASFRDPLLPRRVRALERAQRAATVINNLGRLEYFPRYGDITVERLGFLVSANIEVGAALVISAVTLGATTCLNFTFAEPLLDPDRARRLVDASLHRLSEATR